MPTNKNIILLIEDDEGIAELISEIINECEYDYKWVQSSKEALKWLELNTPYFIILDYGLPDMDGKEFITELEKLDSEVPPFIVSTGQGDERIAVDMMKLGALDYIVKDSKFLDLIPIVIEKVNKSIQNETNLKLALESIKSNEQKQRSMIANISDVIAIIDINGKTTYKSPNIETIFGWKPEELIGHSTFNLVHPDDVERSSIIFNDLITKKTDTVKFECRYLCKNNSYKWIELTATNQMDTPVINGILLNYHDISDRKQAELDLIYAKDKAEESDRLKTAFLQNMSHEIRTPMNAIMGFSTLMADFTNDPLKIKEFSKIINQQCNDLLLIITDILDIAKIESGQLNVNLSNCSVKSIFSELDSFFNEIRKQQDKDHITLSFNMEFCDTDCLFICDRLKLKQILINLIGNAIKFTDKGKVEVGFEFADEQLKFYVADSGVGIPKDKFEKIFERFIQLSPGETKLVRGTGLGLSVVKGLVAILGGSIWLESTLGEGSTFYFSIPFVSTEKSTNKSMDR